MKLFLIKYIVMIALGIMLITIETGNFLFDVLTTLGGLNMFIIIAIIARYDNRFINWLDEN